MAGRGTLGHRCGGAQSSAKTGSTPPASIDRSLTSWRDWECTHGPWGGRRTTRVAETGSSNIVQPASALPFGVRMYTMVMHDDVPTGPMVQSTMNQGWAQDVQSRYTKAILI